MKAGAESKAEAEAKGEFVSPRWIASAMARRKKRKNAKREVKEGAVKEDTAKGRIVPLVTC